MKEVLKNEKSRLIIGLGALILIATFILLLVHETTSKFNITSFKRELDVNYGSEFKEHPGRVCYGSELYCSKVDMYVEGSVDTSKLGRQEITYIYKYKKKKMTLKQVIYVEDTEEPSITVKTDNISICPSGQIKEDYVKVSAVDNYDGDISDKVKMYIEDSYLVVSVSDSSNNIVEKKIEISKEDKEAPAITITGDEKVSIKVGDKYNDLGANASDNCDAVKVEVKNNVNTNKEGTYKVIYTAKDLSGNTSTKERTVVVENKKTSTSSNDKKKINSNNVVYVDRNKNKSGSKIIYLTFDDGPSKHTARLLDVLKKYNVKATFFVTGFGEDSLIKREYDEGHTVALHTYTHDYKKVYSSVENYYSDLYKIRDRVKRITGVESNLIRFPGGSSNTVSKRTPGLMSFLVKDVQAKGFHYYDWNVSSGDAGATTSTNKVYSNVVNSLRSDVSVVLQHDSKGYSVDAVEKIIKFGLENGYTFKTIDENSYGAHHGVNN